MEKLKRVMCITGLATCTHSTHMHTWIARKRSVSPRSSPLGTLRGNGCFRRLIPEKVVDVWIASGMIQIKKALFFLSRSFFAVDKVGHDCINVGCFCWSQSMTCGKQQYKKSFLYKQYGAFVGHNQCGKQQYKKSFLYEQYGAFVGHNQCGKQQYKKSFLYK